MPDSNIIISEKSGNYQVLVLWMLVLILALGLAYTYTTMTALQAEVGEMGRLVAQNNSTAQMDGDIASAPAQPTIIPPGEDVIPNQDVEIGVPIIIPTSDLVGGADSVSQALPHQIH